MNPWWHPLKHWRQHPPVIACALVLGGVVAVDFFNNVWTPGGSSLVAAPLLDNWQPNELVQWQLPEALASWLDEEEQRIALTAAASQSDTDASGGTDTQPAAESDAAAPLPGAIRISDFYVRVRAVFLDSASQAPANALALLELQTEQAPAPQLTSARVDTLLDNRWQISRIDISGVTLSQLGSRGEESVYIPVFAPEQQALQEPTIPLLDLEQPVSSVQHAPVYGTDLMLEQTDVTLAAGDSLADPTPYIDPELAAELEELNRLLEKELNKRN